FRVALEKVSKLGGRFARNPHRKSRLQAHVLKTDVLQVGRHSGLLVRELRKLLLELSRDLLTCPVQSLLRLDAVLGGLIVRLRQLFASPLRKGVLILSRRLWTFYLSSLVHSLIGHSETSRVSKWRSPGTPKLHAAAISAGLSLFPSVARRRALRASLPR